MAETGLTTVAEQQHLVLFGDKTKSFNSLVFAADLCYSYDLF